jgi:membrane protein YqaA with SNARE-associated domain
MLRAVYDRTLRLSMHPKAPWWLGIISFAESSFFPIPPDALLLPMVLARPDKAYRMAALCTAASVAGGVLGYIIGFFLFDVAARPILEAYGYGAGFQRFQELYGAWGLWVILIKGLTPIPYKIVTIASGAAHFDFVVFLLASLATRGVRFFLLAFLVRRYGPPIQGFVEQRLTLVTSVVALAIVLGFVALKLL